MQVRKHSVPLCKYEAYLYKSLQHIEALYGKLQLQEKLRNHKVGMPITKSK